jgi:spore germination cell wall hydrolase CwlJ-like protein
MKYLPNLRNLVANNIYVQTGIFIIAVLVATLTVFPVEAEEDNNVAEAVIQPLVDPKQLDCLAKNVFFEAGAESIDGKAAVARVVMNRIQAGFGSNPCTVIYQVTHFVRPNYNTETEGDTIRVKVCQFSWVCEGKKTLNKDSDNYRESLQVAYDVLAYDSYKHIVPSTTLFFHNLMVNPMWPYKQVAKIGNHVFYEKHRPQKQRNLQVASK